MKLHDWLFKVALHYSEFKITHYNLLLGLGAVLQFIFCPKQAVLVPLPLPL